MFAIVHVLHVSKVCLNGYALALVTDLCQSSLPLGFQRYLDSDVTELTGSKDVDRINPGSLFIPLIALDKYM